MANPWGLIFREFRCDSIRDLLGTLCANQSVVFAPSLVVSDGTCRQQIQVATSPSLGSLDLIGVFRAFDGYFDHH